MTETLTGRAAAAPAADVPCAARALAERCGAGALDLPATAPPREWVESLAAALPAAVAGAVVEHLFGVLPLIETGFGRDPRGGLAEVLAGRKLGALGLFTPSPELRWGAVAIVAEPAGDGYRLHGEVRLPGGAADGALVLVRAGAEHRLAWLDHDQAGGVELHGDSPCRLVVDGAAVAAACVSRPVTLTPGAEPWTHLARYASLWALAAAIWAQRGVGALRRAARTPQAGGTRWSASQLVAMGITEVEIETELTATALRAHFAAAAGADGAAGAGGLASLDRLAMALGAARALSAVAARTVELRDRLGLATGGLLADGLPGSLAAALGGTLMLESELGWCLGAGDPEPPESRR